MANGFASEERLRKVRARYGLTDEKIPTTDTNDNILFKSPSVEKEYGSISEEIKPLLSSSPYPLTITSGFRTPETNESVGGVPTSKHLSGNAVDLRKNENSPQIKDYLSSMGFKVLDEGDHLHAEYGQSTTSISPKLASEERLKKIRIKYGFEKEEPSIDPMAGTEAVAPNIGNYLKFLGKKIREERLQNSDLESKGGYAGPLGGIVTPEARQAMQRPKVSLTSRVDEALDYLPNKLKSLGLKPPVQEDDAFTKAFRAASKGIAETAEPLTSGESLATLATLPAAGPFGNLALAPQMVQGTVESGQEAYKGFKEGDISKGTQATTQSLLNALMTAGLAKGGFKGLKGKPIESTPIPEAPSTVNAQVDALKAGRSNAVLITPGEELPKIPSNMKALDTEVGTWVYDPLKINKNTIEQKVGDGTHGEILGHIEPKSPLTTEDVTAFDKQGNELKSSVVSLENVSPQIDELKKQFPKSEIKVGGEEQALDILKRRLENATQERLKPEGNVTEYIGTEAQRLPSEASSSHSLLKGGEIQEELFQEKAPKTIRKSLEAEKSFDDFVSEMRQNAKIKSNIDLLKEAFSDETGAIGNISDINVERRARAKAARQEIIDRVKIYAKEKGISINEAVKNLNIDPVMFAKMQERQSAEFQPPQDKKTLKIISSQTEPQPLIGATGLKTGRYVEGRPSFNPEKINAPEDVSKIIESISSEQKDFSKQRISKTDADILALADQVGVKIDDLIKAKPGSIANAETVFKSREMVLGLAQDLKDSIQKIDTATATPEQLQLIKEKHLRLMGTMKAVAGFRTEASNIFRQFKLKAKPQEDVLLRDLTADLKRLDLNTENISDFAKKAKELTEPTTADKLWHLWYASILSGPSTHLKNFLGNSFQLAAELARVSATQPKELPASIAGLYQGLMSGFNKAKDILKSGDTSKFEQRGLTPITFKGNAKPLNVFDYVGRLLSASDALFEQASRGMEAGGLARLEGKKIGLKGKALKSIRRDLFKEKFESPEAQAFSERATYTQKPAGVLGVISDKISGITKDFPLAKLIVPFTRIVANVTNNAIDYTPVGAFRAIKPDLLTKKSPFEFNTPRQKYQQLGRAALGTIAMGYFASLAAQDRLSGNGPSDFKHKQQLMSAGWKPNSIKIGDNWIPYSQLGPLALPMALVGGYFDSKRYDNADDKGLIADATKAVFKSANTILDMSFLRGVSDLISAVSESEKKGASFGKNFISQQTSSVVPAFFKQLGRYVDPNVYETNTIGEKIRSNLRLTKGLKNKLDVFGDPIVGERLTQLEPSKETQDPIKKYLSDNQLWITVPSKNTEIKDYRIKEKRSMTDDEYYEYIKQSGPIIKQELSKRLDTLKGMEDREEQQDAINGLVMKIRKSAKHDIESKTR